ncbi:MAG: hypothetical protein SNI45_03340 [Rikenellaceae bacterium]
MIILFATELEAAPFRKACPAAQIVICGVGGAECAATTASLIASLSSCSAPFPTLVLGGIAGSYDLDDVAIGEVVEVCSEQIEALPERFGVKYTCEARTSLRQVSSNSVNTSLECQAPTAQIENMEGAAFMAVCQRAGVRCMQLRAISNRVGDPFSLWQVDTACAALAQALVSHCFLTASGGRG